MPQPAEVDAAAQRLIALFETAKADVEAQLAAITEGNRAARLRELQRTIGTLLDGLRTAARDWLQTELASIYALGASGAAELLGDSFLWTLPHTAALQVLAERVWSDILDATSFVSADVKAWLRDEVRQELTLSLIEGRTARQAAAALADAAGGDLGLFTVRYRNGALHTVADWADSSIRAVSAETYNLGTINQSREMGVQFAEVADGFDCGLRSHDDNEKPNGRIYRLDVIEQYPIAHPRCVMEGTRVAFYGDVEEMVRARFSGPCFELTFATGTRLHTLAVGPHHPVLTRAGWKPAHLVDEGDQLVYDPRFNPTRDVALKSNLEQMPRVEYVFGALATTGSHARVPATADDLHGDGEFCEGDIDVVRPARRLLGVSDATLGEHADEHDLVRAHAHASIVTSACRELPFFTAVSTSARSVVGGIEHRGPGDVVGVGPSEPHRLGLGAGQASVAEHLANVRTDGAEISGDRVARLAGEVSGDDLIDASEMGSPTRARAVEHSLLQDSAGFDVDQCAATGTVDDGAGLARRLCGAGTGAEPASTLDWERGRAELAGDEGAGQRFTFVAVVAVEVVPYDGWVYDATTSSGVFAGMGCTIKNCRRSILPRVDVASTDAESLRPDAQRADQAASELATSRRVPRTSRTPRAPRSAA